MTDTTIIEVAQRDSGTVFSNGDFINELSVPVVIEEGDSLIINKTFSNLSMNAIKNEK